MEVAVVDKNDDIEVGNEQIHMRDVHEFAHVRLDRILVLCVWPCDAKFDIFVIHELGASLSEIVCSVSMLGRPHGVHVSDDMR